MVIDREKPLLICVVEDFIGAKRVEGEERKTRACV